MSSLSSSDGLVIHDLSDNTDHDGDNDDNDSIDDIDNDDNDDIDDDDDGNDHDGSNDSTLYYDFLSAREDHRQALSAALSAAMRCKYADRKEEAYGHFVRASRLAPGDESIYHKRSDTAQQLGERAMALVDMNTAVMRNLLCPATRTARSVLFRSLSREEEALDDVAISLALETDPLPLFERAMAYSRLNQHLESIATYTRLLELSPGESKALINRGIAYRRLNQHSKALQDLQDALALYPGSSNARCHMGISYAALQKYSQALEQFSRSLELDSNFEPAYLLRGMAHLAQKSYELAREDILAAIERLDIKLVPHCYESWLWNYRSQAHRIMAWLEQAPRRMSLESRLQRSLDDVNRTIEIHPRYAEAYVNKSLTILELGGGPLAVQQAIDALDTALGMNQALIFDAIAQLKEMRDRHVAGASEVLLHATERHRAAMQNWKER